MKALPSPSFAMKKSTGSTRMVFSDDGKLLVQITARVVVWDVDQRRVLAQHKLIKNESYAALSPDGGTIAVKNTNGEIVFAETRSGEVISSTGRFRECREGCQPHFTRDGSALIDADWNGNLRLIAVRDAREVDCRRFGDGYMFRGAVAARMAGRVFLEQGAKSKTPGGTRILSLADDGDLGATSEVPPAMQRQADGAGWRYLQQIAVDPKGRRLALVIRGRDRGDSNTLELLELDSGRSINVAIGTSAHYARGLACSRDGTVAVAVQENVYRQGMTMDEHTAAYRTGEHDHIHFYDAASLDLLARWAWTGCHGLTFSPAADALAISSNEEPSAYLEHHSFEPGSSAILGASPRNRPRVAEAVS